MHPEDVGGWLARVKLLERELDRLKTESAEVACNQLLARRVAEQRRELELELRSARRMLKSCASSAVV
jgi:hypothetical protein